MSGMLQWHPAGVPPDFVPDPEAAAKPVRRRFTADYKRSMVEQSDPCRDAGGTGGLLRRDGLWFLPSVHLAAPGAAGGTPPRSGARKTTGSPPVEANRKLIAANARLIERLEDPELIIDVRKKDLQLCWRPIPDTQIDEGTE
jgi:transposase